MKLEPTPPPSPAGGLLARFGSALGASLLWIGLELLLVVGTSGGRFASRWEVLMGTLGHAPAFCLLGLVPAVAAFVLVEVSDGRPGAAERAAPSLGFLFGGLVGYGVGGGRHLASFGVRAGFALLVALAAAAAFRIGVPLLRALREEGRGKYAARGALLALWLGAFVVNRLVLVRLYPAFHLGLSALEGTCFALFVLSLRRRMPIGSFVGWGTMIASACLLLPLGRTSAGFDNYRFVVGERSPVLAPGIELASSLAPSRPIDRSLLRVPLGARRPREDGLDLRGRSILLVTVDALRADHVGAYGYGRPTTPFLDRLAAEGAKFDAAYAATPHTSYSLTSLMTGKYMRPLLMQGAGRDSQTAPELLRTYGYRTAGFYPPAVFFIDGDAFATFRDRRFGFEYAKVEFAEGDLRVRQVEEYLASQNEERPVFLWVHLFGPHEPYVEGQVSFGSRDIDRYDSEIREADRTIEQIVELTRKRDPKTLVVVSADHGEEFGEHGGRYHGTTVYEEQVRVPLLVAGQGVPRGRVIVEPVQTIDVLPTLLAALDVPVPPRVRGRSLGPLLAPVAEFGVGRAAAETEDFTMLAEGTLRLVCARKTSACQLFDLARDRAQTTDLARDRAPDFERLRETSRALAASHGEYEAEGLRAEGKGYPPAILRGIAGDADAAPELGQLLDDADPALRRKAAELLFRLNARAQATALRLALAREEDPEARHWLALGLTRAGQGAPLTLDLLTHPDVAWRRLAALALGEQGDYRGVPTLLDWLGSRTGLSFDEVKQVLAVVGRSRNEDATPVLLRLLPDVRLRPFVAEALALSGDEEARPALLRALERERYATARPALARALLSLGARDELAPSLLRFLGVPDPLDGGLRIARDAKILPLVGGPSDKEWDRSKKLFSSGATVTFVVPAMPRLHEGEGTVPGVRMVALARGSGEILVRRASGAIPSESERAFRFQPQVLREGAWTLDVPANEEPKQVYGVLPEDWRIRPGTRVAFDVLTTGSVALEALALVPLRSEIPPPAPRPWRPGAGESED